jgi:hypothetical protein
MPKKKEAEAIKEQKEESQFLTFMITYGWAILVIIVAIGSLFYFGVVNTHDLKKNLGVQGVQTEQPKSVSNTIDIYYNEEGVNNILALKNLTEIRYLCKCDNCNYCTNTFTIGVGG